MGTIEQTQPLEQPAPMPPSVYLLLWQVGTKGMPSADEMQSLGLNEANVRELIEQYPEEFVELRRMVKITKLMDLHTLGALLRSRLMSQLAQATKPSEIAQLTSAAKQLPAWAMPQGGPIMMGGGGSLLDGSLEVELERIRAQRGQGTLNRQMRRAQASKKRKK